MGKIEPLFPRHERGAVAADAELPHNEMAEKALLGAILANNKRFVQAETLRPEHFYYPAYGRIFGEITRRVLASQEVDGVTLKGWLERDPDIGNDASAILTDLLSSILSKNVSTYAEQIRDLWMRREDILAAKAFIEACQDVTQPIAEAAIRHTDTIDSIMVGEAEVADVSLDDAIGRATAQVRETRQRGRAAGLRIPCYPRLNKHMTLLPKQLTIIAGASGEGKSALAWRGAISVAQDIKDQVQRGRPMSDIGGVVGFSLEMGEESLAFRALSPLCGIPVNRLERDPLSDDELSRYEDAKSQLAGLPLRLIAMGGLTPTMMRMRLRQAKRKLGGKIALIVIDHVQLVSADDKDARGGGAWATGKVADAILGLCKEFACHVVALAQVDSKGIAQRPDKRPTIDDLRWSSNFRQNADQVWFVYRHEEHLPPQPIQDIGMSDDDYRKEVREWEDQRAKYEGRGEVYSGKQRNGPSNTTIPFFFDKPTTTFSEDPTVNG